MKRGRSTNAPTKAQQVVHDAIREAGCLIARICGLGWTPCELHHLTVGGKHGQKRRGQDFVIGLNPYSHRGVPFNGMTLEQCRELFGPSLAREPRAFREAFGSDDALLAKQDELLKEVA
jgi:hypothetical protein